MQKPLTTLSVPAEVAEDSKASEILRVWDGQSGLHCSLQIALGYRNEKNAEAKAWGLILAEIALRIAANAPTTRGASQQKTLNRILELFKAEIENPTGNVKGDFVK